jgi:hypothetical protein
MRRVVAGLATAAALLAIFGVVAARRSPDPADTPSGPAPAPATSAGANGTGTSPAGPAASTRPRAPIDLRVPGFYVGVTHDQHSADDWGDPVATARARAVLYESTRLQNQHLMGWGTLNPEPSPGVYDWASLDERMRLIRASGGTPVLTLCCAPDWMKGGRAGTTDWTRLESAPRPQYYDDFARLAVRALQRYPQVRYVQVWNELKGFYDPHRNRWAIADYTRFYNVVYRAIKQHDPTVQVGGPYVPMDSWSSARVASHPSQLRGPWGVLDQRALDAVDYWLAHKAGADFVTVDASTATRDRGVIAGPTAAAAKFTAVTAWLRARTSLPIWWAEWYAPVQRGVAWSTGRELAAFRAGLAALAGSGARVALLWDGQGAPGVERPWLWSTPGVASGGRASPYVPVWKSYATGTMRARAWPGSR